MCCGDKETPHLLPPQLTARALLLSGPCSGGEARAGALGNSRPRRRLCCQMAGTDIPHYTHSFGINGLGACPDERQLPRGEETHCPDPACLPPQWREASQRAQRACPLPVGFQASGLGSQSCQHLLSSGGHRTSVPPRGGTPPHRVLDPPQPRWCMLRGDEGAPCSASCDTAESWAPWGCCPADPTVPEGTEHTWYQVPAHTPWRAKSPSYREHPGRPPEF